jgi:hypothetical protein
MREHERLLYQANSLPSGIVMLFLVFNTWQTIFTLNAVDVSAAGIRIMEIILLNILLSFLVFIVAFEIKRYSSLWSWVGLGVGVVQCLRVFVNPAGINPIQPFIVFPLLAAGFFLIMGSLWSLVKCGEYRMAKEEYQ